MRYNLSRRIFLALSALTTGSVVGANWLKHASAQSISDLTPVQTGDITANSVIVWTRGNDSSELIVEVSPTKIFGPRTRIFRGGNLKAENDFTGQIDINGLQPDTTYYYKVGTTKGQFKTAPAPGQNKTIRFAWVADLAGQGWGRNPEFEITAFDGEKIKGGYVVFEVIRKFNPDFAIFQGDMIYADNPIPPTKEIPAEIGGGIWTNIPKDFVAITLDEFRDNWKYNLEDDYLRNFLAETPVYVEWDDHEVTNNWYPGEILPEGDPYNGLSADTLEIASRQALFDYNPIRGESLYRSFRHGKHLEIFLLDERTFRDPNPQNSDPNGIEMLGKAQFSWLKQALRKSSATWKVIATHDPFTIVTGRETDRDSWGQNDPSILGREVQLRDLLHFIKMNKIKNVVSITADVHFAAAIQADPSRAVFKDFYPFWEFVVGPINAGAFGPGDLDPSFGPEYQFVRGPATLGLPQNLPPIMTDLQFFGLAEVDGSSAHLTVQIRDITGKLVYEKVLQPE